MPQNRLKATNRVCPPPRPLPQYWGRGATRWRVIPGIPERTGWRRACMGEPPHFFGGVEDLLGVVGAVDLDGIGVVVGLVAGGGAGAAGGLAASRGAPCHALTTLSGWCSAFVQSSRRGACPGCVPTTGWRPEAQPAEAS